MSKFYDSLMRLFICYKCNKCCDTPMIILCRSHCSITVCSDCIAKQGTGIDSNRCFKCNGKYAFTENQPLIELAKLIKSEYAAQPKSESKSRNNFSIPIVSFNDLANPNTNLNDLNYKIYN